MNNETIEAKRIAVIGPTQSGKTCLAVGLYSTNYRGFTIEPVDQKSRVYLDKLKAGFAKRDWPDSTNRGTTETIRLDFLETGRPPVRVSFPDFSGELLGTDAEFGEFANEHFRDLAGAVLLVNPGADAFQSGDPELLADAMAQYKRVISFLRDPNNGSNGAFVALTVTAADRLKGDLKGKLETFDQSVEELSNTLRQSELPSRLFRVTVTGHLKEQGNPKLAKGRKNSASEPFLWLLDELHWRPRRRKIARKVRCLAFIAAVVAAAGAAWCGVTAWEDRKEIGRIERDCRSAIDEVLLREKPADGDLSELRGSLDSLRARTGWFSEKARAAADGLEPGVWNAHKKRILSEMAEIDRDPAARGGDCGRVDGLFEVFVPVLRPVAEEKAALKRQWGSRKNIFMERYLVARMNEKIARVLEESRAQHGEAAFALFPVLYGELMAVSPTDEQTEAMARKAELEGELDRRVEREWRESAIPDFENAAPTAASDAATRAFVKRLSDWNPATAEGAAAKARLFANVSEAVPRWRAAYEARKRAECEEWLTANVTPDKPRTGQHGVWDAFFNEWKNRDSPEERALFDEIAGLAVRRTVENWLADDVRFFAEQTDPSKCETIFNRKFKPLVLRIKEYCDRDARLAGDSWIYRFATACHDVGEIDKLGFRDVFPQTFRIVRVRGRLAYGGTDPWRGWVSTSFGLWADDPDAGENLPVFDLDRFSEFQIKSMDGEWHDLWADEAGFEIRGGEFSGRCLRVGVNDRRGELHFMKNTQNADLARWSPFREWSGGQRSGKERGKAEFGGPFGKVSDERSMSAFVLVNVERTAGSAVADLLREARNAAGKKDGSPR